MKSKKIISICLKILISTCSILGIALACIFAERDGYSHWSKRLLYFTQQSNIWICLICVAFAVLSILELKKSRFYISKVIYALKFVFTISITITGIIFCALLAPFAENYNAWSFSSILTHVIVPLLSIADFFIIDVRLPVKRSFVFYSVIPPLFYFIFASILSILHVDFGRGDTYPYFFMDLNSEVGLFGFKNGDLPQLGTFYWIVAILLLILGISWSYYGIKKRFSKEY